MVITIFSGGTGSAALQTGLWELYPTAQIYNVINGCDYGKSTGVVSKITKTIGVSDFRKNLSRYYELKHKDNVNYNIVRFLNNRYELSNDLSEAHSQVRGILKELGLLSLYDSLFDKELSSFFNIATEDDWDGNDFNLANIIMGAMFKDIGVQETISFFKKMLEIEEINILVPWTKFIKLQAILETGAVLKDEGVIVDWANPNIKINDVIFTTEDDHGLIPGISQVSYPLDKDCNLSILDYSDIIILSSGTQWSSLIPTYKNINVQEALKRNSKKVIFVMNIEQDKDMLGVNSKELLDTIDRFLDIRDCKVIYNMDANESMLVENSKFSNTYPYPMGNFAGKHDPYRLAQAIFITHYGIEQKKFYVFDFDDTLFCRNIEDKAFRKVSYENIKLYNKLQNKMIISGNNYNWIKQRLGMVYKTFPNLDLWANWGLIKYNLTDDHKVEYLDDDYYLSKEEQSKIISWINNYEFEYEIRGTEDHVTTITIIKIEGNRKLIRDKFMQDNPDLATATITGKRSIDISKIHANKVVALDNEIWDRRLKVDDWYYFGDEIDNNDKCVYNEYPNNFIQFKDVFDVNVILKLLLEFETTHIGCECGCEECK